MNSKNLICEDCGTENPDTHKFCSECGNYLLDDAAQNLPASVAAAVQKLETRLTTDYKSPFWNAAVGQPIYKTAAFYLIIAFFYLVLETIGGSLFGINLGMAYFILRVGELSLPLYLAWHLKNKTQKIILSAGAAFLWIFYLISLF